MNESIFNRFRLTVMEQGLGLYGITLYQEGEGVLSHRWRADDKVCLYSGSKTFTAVAVGICRDEGRLSLTDRVLDFFPEYRSMAVDGAAKATLRDLLHMASGKGAFLFSVDERTQLEVDWAELFFKEPQVGEAGERFFYSNACTYMLSRIVEKVSGALLRDYLAPRLFTPLGIHNPQWHTCPKGHTLGATALFLTTSEFAKLGITMLNEGRYGERQIVSPGYIHESITDIIDNQHWSEDAESASGYGYQLWRCSPQGVYRADGMYGQFCIVVPDQRAVVTVTAHEERRANDILRAVYQDILSQI